MRLTILSPCITGEDAAGALACTGGQASEEQQYPED